MNSNSKSFLVLKDWIHKHRSGSGGWNQVQLAAIGIEWPPYRGWMDEVECSEIPEAHREIFEQWSGIHGPMQKKRFLAAELLENLAVWRGDK